MKPENYRHTSDRELLDHFYSDGNTEWLGLLLERYTLLLFGVCMKYLADEEEAKDAVQQIFLKAITELKKYKVSYFKSWLYMVAKNHCLMKLRNKSQQTFSLDENLLSAQPMENEEEMNHLQKDLTFTIMNEALQELNPEQQQCIRLFYLEKQSYQEVAAQTGYNLLQVKSYIQNGKRNLKQIILKRMQNR